MNCQRCKSNKVMRVTGKSGDKNIIHFQGEVIYDCYIPRDINIGGGDYIEIEVCFDCGQLQGEFPVGQIKVE